MRPCKFKDTLIRRRSDQSFLYRLLLFFNLLVVQIIDEVQPVIIVSKKTTLNGSQ